MDMQVKKQRKKLVTSAVLNTTRQAAGAIGVAVFGTMTNGGATAIVHAIGISALISAGGLAFSALLIFKYLRTT
jgi:DHA2 family methylenomycin A resistance protein-like MFS transporter